jgi:hypothetical protein
MSPVWAIFCWASKFLSGLAGQPNRQNICWNPSRTPSTSFVHLKLLVPPLPSTALFVSNSKSLPPSPNVAQFFSSLANSSRGMWYSFAPSSYPMVDRRPPPSASSEHQQGATSRPGRRPNRI